MHVQKVLPQGFGSLAWTRPLGSMLVELEDWSDWCLRRLLGGVPFPRQEVLHRMRADLPRRAAVTS